MNSKPKYASTITSTSTTDSDITMSSSSIDNNIANMNNKSYKSQKLHRKIESWLSKRSESEILFLLTSYSGQHVRIYDEYGSIARLIRVSMDGQYLMMGEETILLNHSQIDSISLGFHRNAHSVYNNDNDNNINTINSNNDNLDTYLRHLNQDSEYYDIYLNNRHGKTIATTLENTAILNKKLLIKNCITLHLKNKDIVFEFENTRQRYYWAKGLSKLIAMKQSKRKNRHKIISYILETYGYALSLQTAVSINRDNTSESETYDYLQKRKDCQNLMDKYVFVKYYSKQSNNAMRRINDENDKMNIHLIQKLTNNSNNSCLFNCDLPTFWNNVFNPGRHYIAKLPNRYALLYRRRMKRLQLQQ